MIDSKFLSLPGIFTCKLYFDQKVTKFNFPEFKDVSSVSMNSFHYRTDKIMERKITITDENKDKLGKFLDDMDTLAFAEKNNLSRIIVEHETLSALSISPESVCEVRFMVWFPDTPYHPEAPSGWSYSYYPKDVLPETVGGPRKRFLSKRFPGGTNSEEILVNTMDAVERVLEYLFPLKVFPPVFSVRLHDSNPELDL